MWDAGCWKLGVGCWKLGVECWVQSAGCLMLDNGQFCNLNTQHLTPSTQLPAPRLPHFLITQQIYIQIYFVFQLFSMNDKI